MAQASDFFGHQQAAAVLKHGILQQYLPVFTNMTGSRRGQVAYIDCYAGPGQYRDGSNGSPAVASGTADIVAGMSGRASLVLHLVERDQASFEDLCVFLERREIDWVAHNGTASEVLPTILTELDSRTPVFMFIDPFGLPVPFKTVVQVMRRGRRPGHAGAATEVLINFTVSGIRRTAGQLDASAVSASAIKASRTIVSKVDDAMGGDWWQQVWRSGDDDRVDQIRDGYSERLRNAAGGRWACFDTEVSDRWQGPPAYHLLFFTQHHDGVWKFNESLSLAQEAYREYCHDREGLLDLDPLEDRSARWIEHIARNVTELLSLDPGGFELVDRIDEVYGDAFGEARERHLRAALRILRKDGAIDADPKGNLTRFRVRRPT